VPRQKKFLATLLARGTEISLMAIKLKNNSADFLMQVLQQGKYKQKTVSLALSLILFCKWFALSLILFCK
jgi:hypothetical protein